MQTPGAPAGVWCLYQPQVSGRQQKPLGAAAASAVFIINKTHARTGEIIRKNQNVLVRAVLWVSGRCRVGTERDGSALEEPPWALQLNCDRLIKHLEVKDLKLTGRSISSGSEGSPAQLTRDLGMLRFWRWACQGIQAPSHG